MERDDSGKLPAFTWSGRYPIVYVAGDNSLFCPACANQENGSEAAEKHEESQWRLTMQAVHWEGDPIVCDHCNAVIKSAYGPCEG